MPDRTERNDYLRAYFTDSTVQQMSNRGCTMPEIVEALTKEKAELLSKLVESSAPTTAVIESSRELLPGMGRLLTIANEIRIQGNLATADPIFYVQALKRYGPMDLAVGDYNGVAYYDHEEAETFYKDTNPEKWGELKAADGADELPEHVTAGGYIEVWETVTPCFTRKGCEDYLEENDHNVRRGSFGVRVFVDSLHRNTEMKAIRNFLTSLHP